MSASEHFPEKSAAPRTPKEVEPDGPPVPIPTLSELARRCAPKLGRLLRHLGIPALDIEDAVQDVFLIAHQRIDLSVREPEAWLRGVALNVARNRRRAARRSPIDFGKEAPEPIDARTPEHQALITQQRAVLARALDALSDDQRAALVLFEIEGIPMKEIALHLECSLPSAYRHLSEAQSRLKQAVSREGKAR